MNNKHLYDNENNINLKVASFYHVPNKFYDHLYLFEVEESLLEFYKQFLPFHDHNENSKFLYSMCNQPTPCLIVKKRKKIRQLSTRISRLTDYIFKQCDKLEVVSEALDSEL